MTIRVRCARSIDEFTAVATSPEHIADTARYVQCLFDTGCSRLEWCWIAENPDSTASARVAFWSLPERETPLDLVLLNGQWRTDQSALHALMQHVEVYFRNASCDNIGHCQDTPPREPQWQTHEAERKTFLESIGFQIARHTLRYRCDAHTAYLPSTNDSLPVSESPLRLVAVNATNESLLVDLVAQVAAVSYDELDRSSCAEHGADEHAKRLLADLREMRVDNDWWRIAYRHTPMSERNEAIGFILPTASADMGTIGYVGVLPAHRGHGYIDPLIAHATRVLRQAKFTRLIADTDHSNKPMARAFERNGWLRFGERLEWKKMLD
jgi:RimJ/RimL family protein N-acetyltransferase